MPNERQRAVHSRATDHVAAAVGTVGGLFLLSDGRVDGPFFAGERVTAVTTTRDHYVAATVSPRHGATVRSTVDAGLHWSAAVPAIAFPARTGTALDHVGVLHDDRHHSGLMYAGTVPAALWRSTDSGHSFDLVESLWDHPDRPRWQGGGSGPPLLHSILTHAARPQRIVVGLARGGVYRSDDAGATWQARSSGIAAAAGSGGGPSGLPGTARLAADAGDPDVLWAKAASGVYRSQDAGDSWHEVGRPGEDGGLPTVHGPAFVAHPAWPSTAYTFPHESEEFPASAGGRCRVYRTSDGGASWEPLTEGLPPEDAWVSVAGDALAVGRQDPYMIAFGTRAGEVYASADGGDSWRIAVRHLPPVLTVRILD